MILEPPELNGKFQRDFDLTMARIEYRTSKDAYKAFSKIKRSLQTIEAQLLLNLKKHGKDLVGALNTVILLSRYFFYLLACNRYIFFVDSSQHETYLHSRLPEFPLEHCRFQASFKVRSDADCG